MSEDHLIEYVCWWEFVCELSETLHSLYSLCRTFWEWDEWPSLRSFGSLPLPSLCPLVTWLHFTFDLSELLLHFMLFASLSSSFFISIHSLCFTSYSFLTATHFRFSTFFASLLHISLLVRFYLLLPHWYYIRIGHLQVHGSRDFLYMLHFIHEGMGFDHWVFEPSFPSFLSPYHPSLHYVLSLKTTLRPWHHTLCLIALMWGILRIGSRAF